MAAESLPYRIVGDRSSHAPSDNVSVTGASLLRLTDGAEISVKNSGAGNSLLRDRIGTIDLKAPRIELRNSGIMATSTVQDLAAGNVSLVFSKYLYLDPSAITTESRNGSGGDIVIDGSDAFVYSKQSRITTSVQGSQGGDGGNIAVRAEAMVFDRGELHADTQRNSAFGGRINLDSTQAIVACRNALRIGGTPSPADLDVIQASASNGINGEIRANVPQLYLSGVLANLGAAILENSGTR